MTISAALIAGGKSTRMGRDKALLEMPGGELLWQRQLRTLEQLQPQEIFWSGFPRENIPPHVRIIADQKENAGPLAGLAACLHHTKSDLLVVLAVDLPQMTADYLRTLVALCKSGSGIVVKIASHFEPLAAVYPREARVLAENHLQQSRHALQDFVREAVKQGLVEPLEIAATDVSFFKNVNLPQDL